MTEKKWVRHSFSHTPGDKVTIASPSPAGEPPGQGGGGQPSTVSTVFSRPSTERRTMLIGIGKDLLVHVLEGSIHGNHH